MATYYVSSVAGDGGDGTTWANAKLSVAAGLALATATGDIVYVDSAHSFTGGAAAVNWDVATANIAVSVISVDRNGSTTTGHNGWLAGATEAVGSGDYGFGILTATSGTMYVSGCNLVQTAGSGSVKKINLCTISGNGTLHMENCTMTNNGTSAIADYTIGAVVASNRTTVIKLVGCTLNLKNTSASGQAAMRFSGGKLEMYGCSIGYSNSNKPLLLLAGASTGAGDILIADCDLSGYNTPGGAYIDIGSNTEIVLRNVKISSVPALTTGTATAQFGMTLINVDSADTKTGFRYYNRFGTITQNTSIYKTTSGATFDGVGISWQVVTSSLCGEATPFVCPWLAQYSTATTSTTVGLRVVHDSATAMHNRNLWTEVEYVSSSTFPQGTLVSTRNAQPFDGSTTDRTADSDSWEGTGGFPDPNKQKVEVTFTPGEGSLIRGRLIVGTASKTLYLNPALVIV